MAEEGREEGRNQGGRPKAQEGEAVVQGLHTTESRLGGRPGECLRCAACLCRIAHRAAICRAAQEARAIQRPAGTREGTVLHDTELRASAAGPLWSAQDNQ